MRKVFADAQYWVALINDKDQSHATARTVSLSLRGARIVTTEEVLTEVLAFFSERGRYFRHLAVTSIRGIQNTLSICTVPQLTQSFAAGLDFYEDRPDKGYSLCDCISMVTMREYGIVEVLSHDEHFKQEGFITLL